MSKIVPMGLPVQRGRPFLKALGYFKFTAQAAAVIRNSRDFLIERNAQNLNNRIYEKLSTKTW